ncbi:MAG TPA: cytochrome c3 family protein [Candidatus Binatia bacterium]|jgi:mono/diheme cytochrome c family protein
MGASALLAQSMTGEATASRRVIGWLILLVFVLTSGGTATAALAQTTAVQKEATCIGCHRPRKEVVDQFRYLSSVHGQQACDLCHEKGFSTFPHDSDQSTVKDCTDCHEGSEPHDWDGIAGAVAGSVHENKVPLLRCTTCHSPHYFSPASRVTNLLAGMTIANESCVACHVDEASRDDPKLALAALAKKHTRLIHAEVHLRSSPCIACHTDLKGRPTTSSLEAPMHKILPAREALADCVACHASNTLLATELYTHEATLQRSEKGWLNSVLFNTAYVTGATRQVWLDWATLGLAVLVVLGVAAHGGGRWIAMRLRKMS